MLSTEEYQRYDANLKISEASAEVRLGFVRKVYGIVAAQLLVTVMVSIPLYFYFGPLVTMNPMLLMMLLVASAVVTMASICALSCCPSARNYPANYIILGFFTLGESFLVGCIAAQYTGPSVCFAFALTALIVGGLTAYAMSPLATDFTGAGPYLFAALLGLSLIGLTIPIMGFFFPSMYHAFPMIQKVYCGLGVILFSFYIVFDTQKIMGSYGGHKHEYGVDEYVFAALNLYLDIINLFLYILELFGDRK
jgi:hypothetical protein